MKKIPTQEAEKPSEAVIERVYNNNELSDGHTENIEHAQDNGLITVIEAGGKLFVKFLDIKNSALLPDKLYHVRHPRDAGAVHLLAILFRKAHNLAQKLFDSPRKCRKALTLAARTKKAPQGALFCTRAARENRTPDSALARPHYTT